MNEVYKVRGMTCEGCANGIKENLESNDYIISCLLYTSDAADE